VVLQHDERPVEQLGAEQNAALVSRLGRAGTRVHADHVAHDPRRVRRRYEDDVLGIPAGALVRHAVPVAVGQLGETAAVVASFSVPRYSSASMPGLSSMKDRTNSPAVDVLLLPPRVVVPPGFVLTLKRSGIVSPGARRSLVRSSRAATGLISVHSSRKIACH
jgi:hypothetical protein